MLLVGTCVVLLCLRVVALVAGPQVTYNVFANALCPDHAMEVQRFAIGMVGNAKYVAW